MTNRPVTAAQRQVRQPMTDSHLTIDSESAIKRFSHRTRFSQVRGASSSNTITAVAATTGFPDHFFDRIVCLEVLEHMTEIEQVETLRQIRRLVAIDGLLLISVPIEIGPSAIVARLTDHPHPRSSFSNVIRSALGVPVERDAARVSHIGFDYRDLKKLLVRCGWEMSRRFVLRPAATSVL